MRCAAYARFSSERQNVRSIEDQLRECRQFAARNGWEVSEGHVYRDEGRTGQNQDRGGFQALLEAAMSKPAPFACILVDDTSRISRNQADALRFYERLAFAGVRLVAVSQGVDTQSEQAELMLGVHGLIDSVYSKELAQKTHRGMAGAALRGTATGGRCFGYRTMKQAAGSRLQVAGEEQNGDIRQHAAHKVEGAELRWEVYEPEAEVVRRVFMMSAGGMGLKQIIRTLNAEGIRSPRPYLGQRHASWALSSMSVLLRNERYSGEIVWNKTRKVRHPETGRRVTRARPVSEWLRRQEERLRIVPQELWVRVQARLQRMNSARGACLSGRRANYLLSGLLECAACGSKMVLMRGGRGRTSVSKYGCPLAERGVCAMRVYVARQRMERRLIDALMTRLSEPAVLTKIAQRVRQEKARQQTIAAQCTDERRTLQTRIERLADVIAAGNHSSALLRRLREMEARLASMGTTVRAREDAVSVDVSTLRAALASKGAELKAVLSRMLRLTAGRRDEASRARCAVWVYAGGLTRTESARPLLMFEVAA
jgi:DNA invertase Pin-like site-specific DNA recombinase